MSEEELAIEVLSRRGDRLAVEVKGYREKFERIARLCKESVDSYYTLKIIQKMAEETNRLAEQSEDFSD